MGTENHTMEASITMGAPMTGDPIIEAIARLGTPMAIATRGAGNYMIGGLTVAREALFAVTADGETSTHLKSC